MDEKAVLEIISGLRNQIAEVKGQMREQHRREIERIESAYENAKKKLENIKMSYHYKKESLTV